MAQGRDPKTGQMRDLRVNEAVDPQSGLIYTINNTKGCRDGGLPIGLPLKGYSQFRPVRAIESGETIITGTDPPKKKAVIQYQFQANGDIIEWQLKKSSHWLLTLGLGFGAGGEGATGGILGVSSLAANGSFEYKIISPSGQTIFWSRVNLCLNGATTGGAYTIYLGQDRSVAYRTRKFNTAPVIGATLPKPKLPTLTLVLDSSGYPGKGVRITYHGMPTGGNKLIVERAIAPDDPDNKEAHRIMVWSELGTQGMQETKEAGVYSLIDQTANPGGHFFYRIKVIDGEGGFNTGDGYSIMVINKNTCRTIIETFIIDGKPTVNHPDPNIPGEDRLTYDEYAPLHIVWPKGREETMFLCPPELTGFAHSVYGPIPIDFDWYGPTYKCRIPNGSVLQLVMDGMSFGTLSQKGRAAEWQFSYKTESVLWGVITDVTGRLLSTAPQKSGAAFITAENINSRETIQTNRAHILFDKGNSAFVVKANDGTIEVFVDENSKTKIYYSNNGGKTFDIRKNIDGTDFTIFESDPHKLIDITKDTDNVTYLLTETGNSIFVTTSSSDFDNRIYVGPRGSSKFRFELSGSEFGAPGVSIIGGGKRYVSDNKGLSWRTRAVIQE